MEAVYRDPGHPRVREICEREQARRPAPSRGVSPEPHDRESAKRNRHDLNGDERHGRRRDDPEWRQCREDRVDMLPDAIHLLAR